MLKSSRQDALLTHRVSALDTVWVKRFIRSSSMNVLLFAPTFSPGSIPDGLVKQIREIKHFIRHIRSPKNCYSNNN